MQVSKAGEAWPGGTRHGAARHCKAGMARHGKARLRWATQTGWGVVAPASHRFERKIDHNRAEAAWLAKYGRRMC
jgi:hypothetical protein